MKNKILIGNNCLVGFTYRDILKQEYQTPFIWSRIWNEDFIKFLEHYKEINFENFELKKVKQKINNNDNDFYILLDNLVKIFFKHNFFLLNITNLRKIKQMFTIIRFGNTHIIIIKKELKEC